VLRSPHGYGLRLKGTGHSYLKGHLFSNVAVKVRQDPADGLLWGVSPPPCGVLYIILDPECGGQHTANASSDRRRCCILEPTLVTFEVIAPPFLVRRGALSLDLTTSGTRGAAGSSGEGSFL